VPGIDRVAPLYSTTAQTFDRSGSAVGDLQSLALFMIPSAEDRFSLYFNWTRILIKLRRNGLGTMERFKPASERRPFNKLLGWLA